MRVCVSVRWHSLGKTSSEFVVGDGYPYAPIAKIGGVRTEQHHLVVLCEVVVGDGENCRPMSAIDQPIGSIGQVTMIHPHIICIQDVNGIAIRHSTPDQIRRRRPDGCGTRRAHVVDVEAVNDDMGDALNIDLGSSRDVHGGSMAIDSLEACHQQLRLQLDVHAIGEDDPEAQRE